MSRCLYSAPCNGVIARVDDRTEVAARDDTRKLDRIHLVHHSLFESLQWSELVAVRRVVVLHVPVEEIPAHADLSSRLNELGIDMQIPTMNSLAIYICNMNNAFRGPAGSSQRKQDA